MAKFMYVSPFNLLLSPLQYTVRHGDVPLRDTRTRKPPKSCTCLYMDWHHHWQIRPPAVLSKLRSSARGLLHLLSDTTTKSISEVNPFNKRAAHHICLKISTL